jgi:hypothetical protein
MYQLHLWLHQHHSLNDNDDETRNEDNQYHKVLAKCGNCREKEEGEWGEEASMQLPRYIYYTCEKNHLIYPGSEPVPKLEDVRCARCEWEVRVRDEEVGDMFGVVGMIKGKEKEE